jgi:hypothetical protein
MNWMNREVWVRALATAKCLLDTLATGLMDAPQEELERGTAEVIARAMLDEREVWNRVWDM